MAYMGRETIWQPAEGNIPGPDSRFVVSAQDIQDDEHDMNNGAV